MNIKSRLEKLEGKLFHDVNSDVCKCPTEGIFEINIIDIDESEDERKRAESQKPQYCDICGKTIERTEDIRIII